jgi:hypothetical protein
LSFAKYCFAAMLLAGLAACGEGSPQGPVATPIPTPTRTPLSPPIVAGALTPPPGQIYFGAYAGQTGLLHGNSPTDTAAFEAEIGRPLTLHWQYEFFTQNLTGLDELDDFAHYRIPVISLNCGGTDAQVANGDFDQAIQLKAIEARNYGWPMFIRYMWDPNLPSNYILGRQSCYDPNTDEPNKVFSPTEYVAAWDHMRAIFLQEGATNVVWLWTVSTYSAAVNPMPYYPGPSEVDWVGMDSYDLSNGSFASTFVPGYAELSPLGKPIMISETGAEGPVQDGFFSGAAATLQTQFPLVKAFLYYDGIDYVTGQNQDWRVTSAAMPAFTSFINDPYMGASYGL